MDRRNTRQKEVILDIMKKDRTHPTICELYQKVKEKDSSIGQATIYRNVAKLCEEGVLKKISFDVDHYDYVRDSHYHLYCCRCHQIYDIFDDKFCDKEELEKQNHIQIKSESVLFEGICRKCLDEKV